MVTISIGGRGEHSTAKNTKPLVKRAVSASLVAMVLIGGGYTWQQTSSARTAQRAELTRVNALQMTERKMQALEREADIAVAAKALRKMPAAAQPTAAVPPAQYAPEISADTELVLRLAQDERKVVVSIRGELVEPWKESNSVLP